MTRASVRPRLQDQSWRKTAACRGEDLPLFFGPDGERPPGTETREAKALGICDVCPVRTPCLDAALVEDTRQWGVRGGMTAEERAKERKRRLRTNTLWRAA